MQHWWRYHVAAVPWGHQGHQGHQAPNPVSILFQSRLVEDRTRAARVSHLAKDERCRQALDNKRHEQERPPMPPVSVLLVTASVIRMLASTAAFCFLGLIAASHLTAQNSTTSAKQHQTYARSLSLSLSLLESSPETPYSLAISLLAETGQSNNGHVRHKHIDLPLHSNIAYRLTIMT